MPEEGILPSNYTCGGVVGCGGTGGTGFLTGSAILLSRVD